MAIATTHDSRDNNIYIPNAGLFFPNKTEKPAAGVSGVGAVAGAGGACRAAATCTQLDIMGGTSPSVGAGVLCMCA